MKINQIIREKRKALSLTQEQMAEYLGVSAQAVNKWEKGSNYPDITLLPALARLLRTDLNTLMSFQDDLSDVEIANFVDEVDKTVREKNYEIAFQMGIEKIHEYPTCERLIYSVITYLNGAFMLYDVSEREYYENTFETFYERLSESESTEIKEMAVRMLIFYNRKRKNYSKAEELIDTLQSSSIEKREQLAILYREQEKYLDAVKIWEGIVLNSVTKIQTSLINMMEIAVKEKRMEDADFYADIYEQVSKMFHVAKWIPYNAKLQLSVIKQDKTKCLSALKSIFSTIHEIWRPQDCPLYSHLNSSETNILQERLLIMLKKEIENGNDFLFLRDSLEYQKFLKELETATISCMAGKN